VQVLAPLQQIDEQLGCEKMEGVYNHSKGENTTPINNPKIQKLQREYDEQINRLQGRLKLTNEGNNFNDNDSYARYKERYEQQQAPQGSLNTEYFANSTRVTTRPNSIDDFSRSLTLPTTPPISNIDYGGAAGTHTIVNPSTPPGAQPATTMVWRDRTQAEAEISVPPPKQQEEGVPAMVEVLSVPGSQSGTNTSPAARQEPTKPATATGMASLDFQLPTDGVLYRFATTRGEVEITARNVSNELLRRAAEILIAVVVIAVLWFLAGFVRRGNFAWTAQPAASTAMIVVGLLALCGGVLPVLGLVLAIAGCVIKIHRACSKKCPA
jgi:hypothetical protein